MFLETWHILFKNLKNNSYKDNVTNSLSVVRKTKINEVYDSFSKSHNF